MLKYLRLFVLLLLGAGLSHQLNAAPTHDGQAQTITATVSDNDYTGTTIAEPYFDLTLNDADAPCDQGALAQTLNATTNPGIAAQNSLEVGTVCIKPNANEENFEGLYMNTAGSRNLGAYHQISDANKNYEGVTLTGTDTNGDNFSVANSANYNPATWTATDHNDGANQTQYFFLSKNSRCATTSAQPDYDFLC